MSPAAGRSERIEPAPHAILFVPGTGQHLFDQSASIVADRVARALQQRLGGMNECTYRISPTTTVALMVGFACDLSGVEIKTSASADPIWRKVLDVYQLKYLDNFSGWFSGMPPLRQLLCGSWFIVRALVIFMVCRLQELIVSFGLGAVNRGALGTILPCRDQAQIALYTIKVLFILTIAIIFWFAVICIAVIGILKLIDINAIQEVVDWWPAGRLWYYVALSVMVVVVIVVILYLLFIKNMESIGLLASQYFCVMDYAVSHRRYITVLHAVRDATTLLHELGHERVDLMTVSLGAILAYDAWYPRYEKGRCEIAPSAGARVNYWISLGFPAAMMQWQFPSYFSRRSDSGLQVANKRINIWIKDDPIGSKIEGLIGFSEDPSGNFSQWDFIPTSSRYREPGPLRDRLNNHCLYWDDHDPGANTCFEGLIDAGWLDDVIHSLRPRR